MTIAKDFASKFAVAFVGVAMIFSLIAPAAQAQSSEDLQKTIADLLAQVAELEGKMGGSTGSSASCEAIAAPLTMGSKGANVTALQNRLIADGEAIAAGATGYFGAQTKAALASWQGKNSVSPAVGYYGPLTAAAMAASCDEDATDEDEDMDEDDSSSELSGEGTLDVFEIDEEETEVSEGAEDEVVMTITAEAADGDIELSRMTFTLTPDTAVANEENDAWDVFETISLWVDGDMVAEFEANDEDNYLNEDDGEFRFSDIGLVLMEDEEVEISVAVTVAGSVDGSDTANAADWNLEPTEVRYFDADGVASTDDDVDEMTPGVDAGEQAHFDIQEEGADDDASIEGNSNTPDSATLLVDEDTSESDEFSVHLFDIEVDEDSSDLVLDDAFVDVTVTNANPAAAIAGGQEDVIADIIMTIDGEEVTGEATTGAANEEDDAIALNGGSTAVRYVFEFDGLDLEADTDYEVEVSIVLEGQDGNYVNGVEIETSVTGSQWEVEGAADDNVLTGTDSSESFTLATVVPVITDVTSDTDRNEGGNAGTISFEFTVEADGEEDVELALADIVRTITGTDIVNAVGTATLAKTAGDATFGGGVWTIEDGDDATFSLDIPFATVDAGDNGTYRVTLDTILGVEVDETSAGMSLTHI